MFSTATAVITPPALAPVSLAEMIQHLQLDDGTPTDGLAPALLAAVAMVEARTGQALITRTMEARFDGWPDSGRALLLPRPPLASVSSVKYLDSAGAEQTLDPASYRVDAFTAPARLMLAPAASWPLLSAEPGAVRVRYVTGYGGPAAVPEDLRAAVRLMAGHLFENREAVSSAPRSEVPLGFDELLTEHRVMMFV